MPSSSLGSFSESFGYDGVNRLTSASDSGGWSRNYGYDRYGNMWITGWSGVGLIPAAATLQAAYNGNNQLISSNPDAAGNARTVGTPAAQYSYDGDGHRVQKTAGGATTIYVYDALGQLAAEYANTSSGTPPCYTCYSTNDHLGSTRMVTDENAQVVSRHDYLPFGEEIPGGAASRSSALYFGYADPAAQKFTGKERDAESGLDYFGAR